MATKSLGHLGVASGDIGVSTSAIDMTTINNGSSACSFSDFDCVVNSNLDLDPVQYKIDEQAFPAVVFDSQGIRHGSIIGNRTACYDWWSEYGNFTLTYNGANWAVFRADFVDIDILSVFYNDGGYNDNQTATVNVECTG